MILRAVLAVASYARRVEDDHPDKTKKRHSGPAGWGLDVGLTNPPHYFGEKLLKLEDEAKGFNARKRGRRVRQLRFKTDLIGYLDITVM